MMRSKEKMSLKSAVYGVFCLWIAVIFSSLFINWYISKKSKEYIFSSIQAATANVGFDAKEVIQHRLQELETISEYITKDDLANLSAVAEKFEAFRSEYDLRHIAVTLSNGDSCLSTGQVVNIQQMQYFQKALNGESNVSYLLQSSDGSTPINVYSVPIVCDNEIAGVLWASIGSNEFYKSLNLTALEQYGETYVITADGSVVSEKTDYPLEYNFFDFINQAESINKKSAQIMEQDLKNGESGCQKFKYDGQEVYLYYTYLEYKDWWVLTKIEEQTLQQFSSPLSTMVFRVSIALMVFSSVDCLIVYTKSRKINAKIRQKTYTDEITEGKNDVYLKYNINRILEKDARFALVSLEIINLKGLITVLGVKTVNQMMKDLYQKLERTLQQDEIVVHSYLGEYKLLLEYNTQQELMQRIEVLDALDAKLKFIMGVYPIDKSDINYEDMCAYTNVAKGNLLPECSYGFYTKELHQKEVDQVQLEESIRQGIANKEFKAWFQPKYASDGKTVVGAEALVRWYREDSIVGPYVFIPLCEANGLIKEIDSLVLEDVCLKLKQWMNESKNPVPVSVNLSRNYLDDSSFIRHLKQIIALHQIPQHFIEFEVTESAMVGNEKELKETIEMLHGKGFKILLDDFGVGYSSIKTVSDLHFDTIKIDKSFVDGIGKKRWEKIIEYTIELSKQLEMDVVAEGVETKEQYEFLLKCGCNVFQGYYFGKPMDSEHFSALLYPVKAAT